MIILRDQKVLPMLYIAPLLSDQWNSQRVMNFLVNHYNIMYWNNHSRDDTVRIESFRQEKENKDNTVILLEFWLWEVWLFVFVHVFMIMCLCCLVLKSPLGNANKVLCMYHAMLALVTTSFLLEFQSLHASALLCLLITIKKTLHNNIFILILGWKAICYLNIN